MHEFVAGFLAELLKTAGKADEILVQGEHAKLTKGQVAEYYLDPKTRKRLLPQLTGRPVMLVQQHGDEGVVRRKDPAGGEILIDQGAKGEADPSDYMNWVSRHTVEFHPSHGEEVDHLYVDIDPKGNVPWEKTKEIVKAVASTLRKEPDVTGARVVYSGGRGFYVKAPLTQPVQTNKARERLKKLLGSLSETIPAATLGVPGPSQVRLDVSTLHPKGSLRAEYSLNRKTGLVSIPVHNLEAFKREDATIERVLSRR